MASQQVGQLVSHQNRECGLLVLMDSGTLDAIEMWEASYSSVAERLSLPGAKSREREALGISEFKAIAKKVWPA